MRDNLDQDRLAFSKMHGLGNDFVIIDSRGRSASVTPELAKALGDRHRGVGYDQLAEILDGDTGGADIALDFWNSDGSRAGACGNATRCVADKVLGETGKGSLLIRTARGLLQAVRDPASGFVSVNMGAPQVTWHEVPLAYPVDDMDALPIDGTPSAVGMGNPHCVFFVPDAEAVQLDRLGPQIERHALFPQGTNVEFVSVRSDGSLRMRVWERGTGITLACGSGACAVAVAAHRRGLAARRVTVHVDGGALEIDWRDDGAWMSGPTAHVFDATLDASFLGTA